MQRNKFSKEEEREKKNEIQRKDDLVRIGHIYHSSFMTRLEQGQREVDSLLGVTSRPT